VTVSGTARTQRILTEGKNSRAIPVILFPIRGIFRAIHSFRFILHLSVVNCG